MTKKPWLAALLNIIIAGLGYIYVGKRILFGVLLIIMEILAYIWYFIDSSTALTLLSSPLVLLSGLIFIIAIAIDAYKDAKEINQSQ